MSKLVVKIFAWIIIIGLLAVCINWLLGSFLGGLFCQREIPSLSSLFGADLPEQTERVQAVSYVSGKVTIPDTVIIENNPTLSPVAISLLPDSITLPVEIITVVMHDTVLVTAKVGGVRVQLKKVTYIRQVSAWERWRLTLSGIPAIREPVDVDFAAGVAYRLLRWHEYWAGLGLSVDLPDFGWLGAGLRLGWYFSDNGSLDVEGGYAVGDRGGLYFSLGCSLGF